MSLLDRLAAIVGPAHVLTGKDSAPYGRDWMGEYEWQPLAVVRPGSRDEVAAVMRLAQAEGVPVVPIAQLPLRCSVSGNKQGTCHRPGPSRSLL